MKKIRMYTYYILIGAISFISVCFLPMLQSSIGLEVTLPKTKWAWGLWLTTRACVSALNMLIFHCFICQADINTQDSETRKEAEAIINKTNKSTKETKPKSPKEFFRSEYVHKLPTILLSTMMSLIAFGTAILTFEISTFLTYLFTVVMAIVFGILEMFKVETYYTVELMKYAKMIQSSGSALQAYYEKYSKETNREINIDCQYLGGKK